MPSSMHEPESLNIKRWRHEEGRMSKSLRDIAHCRGEESRVLESGWCSGSKIGGAVASFNLESRRWSLQLGRQDGRVLTGRLGAVDPISAGGAACSNLPSPVAAIWEKRGCSRGKLLRWIRGPSTAWAQGDLPQSAIAGRCNLGKKRARWIYLWRKCGVGCGF